MKILKKSVAVFLSLVMLFSAFSVCGFASDADLPFEKAEEVNHYPFIFVHGLGGWGQYDVGYEIAPHFGDAGGVMGVGEKENYVELLRRNGYDAYAVSVGPINSAWDRACEIYAQLTGTKTDYGEAHSKEHDHERYGKDYTGIPLMGTKWDTVSPINLIGHSFGGPASRMFASILAYGDEAEIEASGDDVSPFFLGGKEKSVHSIITFSGCHNGSQMANFLVDFKAPMFLIAMLVVGVTAFMDFPFAFYSDVQLAHFGLSKENGFHFSDVMRVFKSKDNASYDLTVRGSQEVNEKIKMSPYTYYYSYSGVTTTKLDNGMVVNSHSVSIPFMMPQFVLSSYAGKTLDGIYMDETWAMHDGMVPLASALYPLNEKDNAFPYEESAKNGTVKPGSWYYMEPVYGMDHGDYCSNTDAIPNGSEAFYLELANMVCSR